MHSAIAAYGSLSDVVQAGAKVSQEQLDGAAAMALAMRARAVARGDIDHDDPAIATSARLSKLVAAEVGRETKTEGSN